MVSHSFQDKFPCSVPMRVTLYHFSSFTPIESSPQATLNQSTSCSLVVPCLSMLPYHMHTELVYLTDAHHNFPLFDLLVLQEIFQIQLVKMSRFHSSLRQSYSFFHRKIFIHHQITLNFWLCALRARRLRFLSFLLTCKGGSVTLHPFEELYLL